MGDSDKNRDLPERVFRFAVDVIKFLKTIKNSRENDVIHPVK